MSAEIIPFPNAPRESLQAHEEREWQEYLARVKQVAADLIAEINAQRAQAERNP